jgi:pimeloyl-ACP methyl ester carboxylesterase
MIRRRFADLAERQVHYREAGDGPPLLMLHASPGSSKQLEAQITALARQHRVIAPDTPGNGDSTPLPLDEPAIADYAAAAVEFLDAIGLQQFDVYGSHTGAHIGLQLALLAPERIGKVVIDGIGLFSDAERANYLTNYALSIQPDLIGSQFQRAFMFCRDQYIFWPWFETAAINRRDGGLPSPQILHDWVLEVCKSITTYHLSYRAAFSDRAEENLAKAPQPLLFLAAENDPLLEATKDAAKLAMNGRLRLMAHSASPGYVSALAEAIEAFLEPA